MLRTFLKINALTAYPVMSELKDGEGAGLHPCAENQEEIIKT